MAKVTLETMEGTIEAVARSGKALKIGDDWFNAFNARQLNGAKAGDEVQFEYELKKVGGQHFRNIKGDVEITTEGEEPEERPARGRSSGGSGGGNRGNYASRSGGSSRGSGAGGDAVQRMIVRQNSLTQANAMLNSMAQAGAMPDFDGSEELANTVIELARLFEAYVMEEA